MTQEHDGMLEPKCSACRDNHQRCGEFIDGRCSHCRLAKTEYYCDPVRLVDGRLGARALSKYLDKISNEVYDTQIRCTVWTGLSFDVVAGQWTYERLARLEKNDIPALNEYLLGLMRVASKAARPMQTPTVREYQAGATTNPIAPSGVDASGSNADAEQPLYAPYGPFDVQPGAPPGNLGATNGFVAPAPTIAEQYAHGIPGEAFLDARDYAATGANISADDYDNIGADDYANTIADEFANISIDNYANSIADEYAAAMQRGMQPAPYGPFNDPSANGAAPAEASGPWNVPYNSQVRVVHLGEFRGDEINTTRSPELVVLILRVGLYGGAFVEGTWNYVDRNYQYPAQDEVWGNVNGSNVAGTQDSAFYVPSNG